ncbi:MAG: MBL fold metallo-hydrolase [Gammaproteobacteria bacterium]|nr:MBL fold metallo-hydrolase [Gammaproteobacteria bacterium]
MRRLNMIETGQTIKLAVLAFAVAMAAWAPSATAAETDPLVPQAAQPYGDGLLRRLRDATMAVPGSLPSELRYITVAESHRPRRVVLDGGSDEPYVQARTAFQLVYEDSTLMVDAGMDEAVHRTFGMGAVEPYWPERNAAVQDALAAASLIVITHEHGDHVAGVVRSPNRRAIAARTILTKAQAETLVLAPQSPLIRLTPAQAAEYRVIDYARFHPVAPGVVLVKAPGHTPGHQMVFVRLESGTEYLLSADVTWALDGIAGLTQRPQATSDRIKEDRDALRHQIRWLNVVLTASGTVIVPSHDAVHLADLERRGLITEGLVSD